MSKTLSLRSRDLSLRAYPAGRAAAGRLARAAAACRRWPARSASSALDLPTAQATQLGRALAPELAAHPGLSGIHALDHPHDAFAARVLLARAAERTLDVQYYIWRGDHTGTLLLASCSLKPQSAVCACACCWTTWARPGWTRRWQRWTPTHRSRCGCSTPSRCAAPRCWATWPTCRRANRRMHNKSFTADNQASIVGGRNVGDEYFGATTGVLFADLDVLAIGPVVHDVSADFDRYWASASAYPAQDILPAVAPAAMADLAEQARALLESPAARDYAQAIAQRLHPPVAGATSCRCNGPGCRCSATTRPRAWARRGAMACCCPNSMPPWACHSAAWTWSRPTSCPRPHGVEAFARLRQAGVRVRVLTNAFEATDVPAVHAGYAKYRQPLLELGVTLYEMRRLVPEHADQHGRPLRQRLGSSGSSLHAKTFAVDGERLFVGSLNFDPRSALLNTELGFLIDSPALAQQVAQAFEHQIPLQSYRVTLTEDGALQWHSGVGDPPPVYATEPHTTWWSRTLVSLLMWLPIEWLL